MNIPERPPGEDLHGASWMLVFVSWWIDSLATLGARFLSGCMQYVLCVPCWYQRIFMLPLVPLLLVGPFTFDRRVVRYALPLGVIGWHRGFPSAVDRRRRAGRDQAPHPRHTLFGGADHVVRFRDDPTAVSCRVFNHQCAVGRGATQEFKMNPKTLLLTFP